MRSLLFLLASGTPIKARQIVPIIIDPDKDNGDVERSMRLLNQYREVRRRAGGEHSQFFGTDVDRLGEVLEGGAVPPEGAGNFRTDLGLGGEQTTGETFRKFLQYDQLDNETKALMQLLYSEEKHLELDLTVGFKGNPHMGSVVLNRMKDSKDFEHFVSQLQPNDRIFIVSSIFGGTGAAGFPLLVKNIREPDSKYIGKAELMRRLPLGAVSVLPYFGVRPDQGSAINSDTFISKTKAALAHYNMDLHQSLNALYYIGDEILRLHDNNEGRAAQINDAHFVELAAAMAVVDFMEREAGELSSSKYFEFGVNMEGTAMSFNFNHLGKQSKDLIAPPLSSLFYFSQYLRHRLPETVRNNRIVWVKGNPGQHSQPIEGSLLNSDFYSNQLARFTEQFLQWLNELANNQRAFAPFNLQTPELQQALNGVAQARKGTIFKSDKWTFEDFDNYFNEAEKKGLSKGLTAEQKLLALAWAATQDLYQDRIAAALQ